MRKVTIFRLIELLAFLLSAFLVVRAFPVFCEDYGSNFATLGKYFPFYLEAIISIYFLITVHLALTPKNFKRQKLTLMVNGGLITCLSFVVILLIAIFVSNGTYAGMVYGYPTSLYPLDAFIIAFLYLIFGFLLFLLGKKYLAEGVLGSYRKDGKVWVRVILSILYPLSILFLLFYCGDLLSFFRTFDYSFSHFGASLSVYFMMLVPLIGLALYEYLYVFEEDEEKKKRKGLILSRVFAPLGVAVSVYYLVAYAVDPDFVVLSLVALFPLDFMISMNVGPLTLLLLNAVPPIVFLCYTHKEIFVKGINLIRKKDRE